MSNINFNGSWADIDFYQVLEIDQKADSKEIKKSFFRLSRKFHPDLNKNDKEEDEKYRLITEAYDVLSSIDKREQYDIFLNKSNLYLKKLNDVKILFKQISDNFSNVSGSINITLFKKMQGELQSINNIKTVLTIYGTLDVALKDLEDCEKTLREFINMKFSDDYQKKEWSPLNNEDNKPTPNQETNTKTKSKHSLQILFLIFMVCFIVISNLTKTEDTTKNPNPYLYAKTKTQIGNYEISVGKQKYEGCSYNNYKDDPNCIYIYISFNMKIKNMDKKHKPIGGFKNIALAIECCQYKYEYSSGATWWSTNQDNSIEYQASSKIVVRLPEEANTSNNQYFTPDLIYFYRNKNDHGTPILLQQ